MHGVDSSMVSMNERVAKGVVSTSEKAVETLLMSLLN